MHADLRDFILRIGGVVATTLIPVILTAFLSIPLNLGRVPGEAPAHDTAQLRHMT